MSNNQRLSVPSELQHLIEKRRLQDRREAQRLRDAGRRESDPCPAGTPDLVENPESQVTEDQPSGQDSQKEQERRRATRRKEDGQ